MTNLQNNYASYYLEIIHWFNAECFMISNFVAASENLTQCTFCDLFFLLVLLFQEGPLHTNIHIGFYL